MVSLWCELLCKLPIYLFKEWSVDNNMVSKIWVGMATSNIHLLQSKFKVTCKNMDHDLSISEFNTKEKLSKISNITFVILPFFLLKVLKLNCHPEYFGDYFSWWNHQMHFKMVHSNTENAKSRACQSQMCYLRTTHSLALNICLNLCTLKRLKWESWHTPFRRLFICVCSLIPYLFVIKLTLVY